MSGRPDPMVALRNGNSIRRRRSEVKRELAARTQTLAGVLIDPPAWMNTMAVTELLLAVPGLGPQKVDRILAEVGVRAPGKQVGELSPRQCAALAKAADHPRRA